MKRTKSTTPPIYPSLYQINTRVLLTELTARLGHSATLDYIPDSLLDEWAQLGFDWIWLLSVWQTGAAGQQISRTVPEWRKEFEDTLLDLKEEDIGGSGFAVTGYTVHESLGGEEALKRLRDRLHKRGLKLMLDFIPNHMAMDHPWIAEFPEYFIQGRDEDLTKWPKNFIRIGDTVFAHGRDPYFPGWPDTVQLNYANPDLQSAMQKELLHISGLCDGVRCDMAMLILPDVFERTWGMKPADFWLEATRKVRAKHNGFVFMAEVYWDLEWTLQQEGFDYTYDKRLYDRLHEGNPRTVRDHLRAEMDFQNKLARFLENHDEPRVNHVFPWSKHQAAAIITFLTPGLRFFHQGQFEGRKKRISPHLVRAPLESFDDNIHAFYMKLLEVLRSPVVRNGTWRLLECAPAWDGNSSNDLYIGFAWEKGKERIVALVNYSDVHGQCYVKLPFEDLAGKPWRWNDLLSDIEFGRNGDELASKGLYLDEPGWRYYVFELTRDKR